MQRRPDKRPGRAVDDEPIVTPDRIITLTDGVVAIAMTLLVLDLNGIDYHGSSPGGLWHALNQQSGKFLAFFIAFWLIARFWQVHHRVFRRIARHDDAQAMRNFWFLFGISVLPFTTQLLGQTSDNPLPLTLFSANLIEVSLALFWLSSGAERLGAAPQLRDEHERLLSNARLVTTVVLVALPAAAAWGIQPGTAALLYLLLFLVDVPGRLLARRRSLLASRADVAAG